jgi:hypothetical protein
MCIPAFLRFHDGTTMWQGDRHLAGQSLEDLWGHSLEYHIRDRIWRSRITGCRSCGRSEHCLAPESVCRCQLVCYSVELLVWLRILPRQPWLHHWRFVDHAQHSVEPPIAIELACSLQFPVELLVVAFHRELQPEIHR